MCEGQRETDCLDKSCFIDWLNAHSRVKKLVFPSLPTQLFEFDVLQEIIDFYGI